MENLEELEKKDWRKGKRKRHRYNVAGSKYKSKKINKETGKVTYTYNYSRYKPLRKAVKKYYRKRNPKQRKVYKSCGRTNPYDYLYMDSKNPAIRFITELYEFSPQEDYWEEWLRHYIESQ